jgi:site-specific DNA-methyltransferase (cytosine-N4-specific)
MYKQLSLIPTAPTAGENLTRQQFSHHDIAPQQARITLEKEYAALLEETTEFNRKLVSYQGNKARLVHNWIKYREGYSAQLVEMLLHKFGVGPGDTVLDPFAGSATTLLVAKSLGIDAVGIELLPLCHLAWQAKAHMLDYDLTELRAVYEQLQASEPGAVVEKFPHVPITEAAFSPKVENDIMFYTAWFANLDISQPGKQLCRLILTSVLEEVSYTRKDGQYLRWDYRSEKVQKRNNARRKQGKEPIRERDFGALPAVKEALSNAFAAVLTDIARIQKLSFRLSRQQLVQGNTLLKLPTLEPEQSAAVITSPPYCNRYDYTRTYALEITYLKPEHDIRDYRQDQLSCTVENRSKLAMLQQYYQSLEQPERYTQILAVVQNNPAFQEINEALRRRWKRGDMNNRGVLSMVEQYFTELTFVFAELFRVCKRGASVAFVNDNVRYGGEVIPVDLLCTNLAEMLGFEPVKVYVLPQRKGNSSQQMGRFGRVPLRKSITIWRKP